MTAHLDSSSLASRTRGLTGLVARMWQASPPLTAVGFLMLLAAAASVVGVIVDPRVITGAPAWVKPLKFAVSTAIYSLTLAWMFTYLAGRPRVRRVVGWTTAVVFVLELAIIDVQAARGTTSHFNGATPLDQILYAIMGAAIVVQTLVSIAVVVALFRQRFADRALAWALRLGMALTILGAFTGGLMTRPTPGQLAALRAGATPTSVGAHTVGGPDGGPGVPVTEWSRDHGDLRVPHFLGLHAIQALALIAVATRRRRSDAVRAKLVIAGAVSYTTLFGLLLWQALRGVSLAAPDTATAAGLAIWAASTLLVVGTIVIRPWCASHAAPDPAAA